MEVPAVALTAVQRIIKNQHDHVKTCKLGRLNKIYFEKDHLIVIYSSIEVQEAQFVFTPCKLHLMRLKLALRSNSYIVTE